ncbi:signal transduction histidine kinase [Allostreptomyces psammosilenae]|uniref:histidine kinase n=1 Tax=Allostreptomyces psammosilenae TaxID=1892865 RepID=A0A853A322_9ACTN|nr:HAMP domain-containing sensor histidine kinase [Allostreptomyces psammosilenae]NYI07870.1 signal transduction histidine kinase [Allostreptomyces psammosilenae]
MTTRTTDDPAEPAAATAPTPPAPGSAGAYGAPPLPGATTSAGMPAATRADAVTGASTRAVTGAGTPEATTPTDLAASAAPAAPTTAPPGGAARPARAVPATLRRLLGDLASRLRRTPARVQILLWLLLVMAAVLVSVAVILRALLLADVERDVSALLEQEAEEFHSFAAQGVDPATGVAFTDPGRLLRTHLERQQPAPEEELFGLLPARDGLPPQWLLVQRVTPSGQVADDASGQRLSVDPALRAAVAHGSDASTTAGSGPALSGTLSTPTGPVHWARTPFTLPGPDSAAPAPDGWFVIAYDTSADRAGVASVMRAMVAVSVFALLCGALVAWVVAGRILAPIRVVRRAAARITEQELTRRIPVTTSDDVGALAETFNAMLDRLEGAFAAQRQFVDDAGHELRTPITIVRGHLELLDDDPREREETIRLVMDELDRMSRIVEDLLLLAKSERSDFVRTGPVELAELTSDVYAKARALGERRWVLDSIGEGLVWVDPQRVTQALVQLAQNAVQHTAPGDEVRIGSQIVPAPLPGPGPGASPCPAASAPVPTDDADRPRAVVAVSGDGAAATHHLVLRVIDTGPGVPPRDRERIFGRFARSTGQGETTTVTSLASRHRPGAGLGLAIVRAIALGHGGTVRVTDTPGGGATFELLLPHWPERFEEGPAGVWTRHGTDQPAGTTAWNPAVDPFRDALPWPADGTDHGRPPAGGPPAPGYAVGSVDPFADPLGDPFAPAAHPHPPDQSPDQSPHQNEGPHR